MAAINRMHGDAIKIVQLYYVRAAAELGSFSRAAAALGVTQPALSHGIAALERALGGPLFDRSTTGVTPTTLAVRILPYVHSVLGSLDSLLTEARVTTSTEADPLRVGLSPLIHAGLVGRVCEAARRQSAAGLILQEKDLASLREELLGRRLDLVLAPAVSAACNCRRLSLDSEPLHYLCDERGRQEGRQAGRKTGQQAGQQPGEPVELSELAERALVMVGDACGLATVTRRLFADAGAELLAYPGEADSYRSVEDWARLGLGGALLPRSRFQDEAGTRPVHRDGQPVLIRYEALWLAGTPRADAVESLLEALQAAA